MNPVPGQAEIRAKFAECEVLFAPVLTNAGFVRSDELAGKGSGGYFESATYSRDDRVFDISLRYESLLIEYSIDKPERARPMPHADYMRHLLGPAGGNHFPAFADDALAACRALVYDP